MLRDVVLKADMAEFVTCVRREQHIAMARVVREMPDAREPGAAIPPPRSAVDVHQELRGVMMTSGGAEGSRPGMRASTLQASVFSIVAWATKRATAWTLGCGVQPFDFMCRNLEYRRSKRFRVLRAHSAA